MAIISPITAEHACTSVGTFADPDDTSCQTYYVCSVLSNGTYIPTVLTCDSPKSFDPSARACSESYICNTNSTPSTTVKTLLVDFQCNTTGRFENPNDLSCTTYYLCSKYYGTFIKTLYRCPISAYFDPDLHRCTTQHICATATTTTPEPTTTTTPSTTTAVLVDFQCTQSGRFENSNDLSCTTYYLCSKYYGTYMKTLYKCPASTYFDPDLHRCTTQHVCATATTITTTPEATTTTTYADVTTEEETNSLLNITSFTSDLVPTSTTISYDFVCTTRGRYADFKDNACKGYYLCNQLRNGTLLRTAYSCPSNSVFDQSIYKCTTVQDCTSIRNSGFVVTPQFNI